MRAAGERKLSSFPGRNPGPSSGALRPSRGFFFFFFFAMLECPEKLSACSAKSRGFSRSHGSFMFYIL